MAIKYLSLDQLTHYHEKLKENFVVKELKTGSDDQYKVLSDNNLTDALLAKLNSASTFNGAYGSLTGKPAIDGTELSADSTAESLGLAKTADIPGLATTEAPGIVQPDGTSITIDEGIIKATAPDLSTYAKKSEIPGVATADAAGIVKPDGTSITVIADGTISAALPDMEGYVQDADIADMLTQTQAAEEYAKKTDAATKAELADYAKSTQVSTDIGAAKTELQGKIDDLSAKVSAAIIPKGSTTFAELPVPSADSLGFMYNISDSFVTDDKFEKESESYPAGTNVVVVDAGEETYKYDVFSGFIDTSGFQLKSDLVAITEAEVDALFTVAEPSS